LAPLRTHAGAAVAAGLLAVACLGCAHTAPGLTQRGMRPANSTVAELDEALEPRRVAVLIGIDDYLNPIFPDLRYAASDANALGDLMMAPETGGFDRVVRLADPRTTTRAAILRELRNIRSDVARQDIFVLYFSGHGTLAVDGDGDGQLFLLPADADPADLEGSAIHLDALRDFLATLATERKALIVDACFHGDGKSVADPSLEDRADELVASLQQSDVRGLASGEAHLFASTLGRPAFEDQKLGRGVYTHYLLQAMTWARADADLDGDGLLTAWEAHDFARARTSDHTGGSQIPEASLRVVGANDLVLAGEPGARSESDRALVFQYDKALTGSTLIVDGQAKGIFPGTLPVEPGNHHIEVRRPDGTLEVDGYATFKRGQSVSTSELKVLVREDRALQAIRVGVGGGPPAWGELYGDGFVAIEAWGALRKARGAGRGLHLGGSLGVGVSPTRRDVLRFVQQGRVAMWTGLDAGWGTDFRRLRLRVAWQLRLTVLPLARLPGPEHELLPEEAGWVFGSMGPMLHVGVVLDRRLSFVMVGSLQTAPLDLNGDGQVRLHPFGTLTAGLELGL